MTMGEIIKNHRTNLKLSQEELGLMVGVNKAAVQKWESGAVQNMKKSTIQKLSEIFGISPANVMGWVETTKPPTKGVWINVYGTVAAGIPIEAIEDIIDTEEISAEMARNGEHFGLQIKGDSMEPRIKEGDNIIVRKQENAENGDVVVAMVNGNDAVCKKLVKQEHGITLVSTNPEYDPMYFSNKDIEELPVRIIGKVVELRGKF